jgi:hypothetical protein
MGVTSEVYGMRLGRAAVGQQASFQLWQEGGNRYLGMTIFQISAETGSDRRGRAAAQLYQFPVDWVSQHDVRLAALYDAAIAAEIPRDGDARPLRLDVALGNYPIVERLRHSAQGSTRLLRLAGAVLERPVIVTNGPLELKKRLDLLDFVLTLLPAWFRPEVSVTTWTDKPRKEYRLAFGGEADRGYTAVSWEAGIAEAAGIGRYATLLQELCTDPERVESVIRFLGALDPTEARSGKRGTSTRAVDDLAVFHGLWTFNFTLPPDRERVRSLLRIVHSENARHLALGKINQIPAFAIAAAGIGVTEAVDLLSALWSAEITDQTGLAVARYLADGRLAPAQSLMAAAVRADSLDSFLRAVIKRMPPLSGSGKALSTFTGLLAEAAESADTFAAACPALLEVNDLSLQVLAVIARDRPKALAISISSIVRAADAHPPAPIWTKAIAPWSQGASSGRRDGGPYASVAIDDETANSVWSQLAPDAVALAWAVSHALNVPDPVEYTWTLLVESSKNTSVSAATADVLRSQEFGWALSRRFGPKFPAQTRAYADLARISIGLTLGDVPESGESETTVRQYVGSCLAGCRSPRLSPEDQRELRRLLSDNLLVDESPATAPAARTLLDALADSENEDDQEWLISQLLDYGGKRPRATEWLRGMGQKIISSRVRSPSLTTEIEAARNLRLAVRSLKETEAETSEALDLLAQAAASGGFKHRQNASAVGTILREMQPWPGCRRPASVANFLDRWKQELTRRGLPVDEAESRADDAIAQIMSGIWGTESAIQLGDYYSKIVAVTISRLEERIDTWSADRARGYADIAERRAEIQKLEAALQAIDMRINATRAEIIAKERLNAKITRLLFPQSRQDR